MERITATHYTETPYALERATQVLSGKPSLGTFITFLETYHHIRTAILLFIGNTIIAKRGVPGGPIAALHRAAHGGVNNFTLQDVARQCSESQLS